MNQLTTPSYHWPARYLGEAMASIGIKRFNWLPNRSAWQETEYRRIKRAAAMKEDQATMDTINSAMSTALQNKISGSSNIAANVALKRVQAAAKAKSAETTKQIDEAQKLINKTKLGIDSASTT